MKKKILFAALMGALLTGCGEKVIDTPIVDWNPVNITIYATDSAGNSIIQPQMPGMSLTFKGQEYTVTERHMWYDSILSTKFYMPTMYGLYPESYQNAGDTTKYYRLVFGEIDGAADMDEDIILKWPNGTTDVIHYHCSDHNVFKISCNRNWKLNGKKHDGGGFYFSGK